MVNKYKSYKEIKYDEVEKNLSGLSFNKGENGEWGVNGCEGNESKYGQLIRRVWLWKGR